MKNTSFFWFTGLSGSGKTTVARGVQNKLQDEGYSVFVIDGDEVRERFHGHLGFSSEDIKKNNALIVDICKEKDGQFDIVFIPIISPFAQSRGNARKCLGHRFYEIYFQAGLDYLVSQDVKGLYAKAKQNVINDLIGFSEQGVSYEIPENPDFIVYPENEDPEDSINALYDFVILKLDKKTKISQ